MRQAAGRLGLLVGSTVLLVLGAEAATGALFRWPQLWVGRLPRPIETTLRAYHASFIGGGPIQYRSECSESDAELLYRLKPGVCRFATDEFDTSVRVSDRHLREDRVIDDPDLVVLGDSFSLGWGVEREAAYPAVIARDLGVREVVVANSSYGTVRELLLLRRLSLRDFRVIVLQYSQNDVLENRSFLRAGRHIASSHEDYQATVALWRRVTERSVLPRVRGWFSLLRSNLQPGQRVEAWPGPTEQAQALLDVLASFTVELRGRTIVLFGADMGGDGAEFVQAIESAPKPPGLGPLFVVDAARGIQSSDQFLLDSHWRPGGHAKVAAALEAALVDLTPTWGSRPAEKDRSPIPTRARPRSADAPPGASGQEIESFEPWDGTP